MVDTAQLRASRANGRESRDPGPEHHGPTVADRVTALGLAHRRLMGPVRPEEAETRRLIANELVREGVESGVPGGLVSGLLRQTVDLFADRDRHADRRLAELRDVVRRRYPDAAHVVGAIDVMLAIRAGELDLAEARARECREQGAAVRDADAAATYRAQLCAVRWYQGRIREVRPTLEALLPGRDVLDVPRSADWLAVMYGVVEAAYLRDDAATAARVYEALRPYAEMPVIAGLGVLCLGSAHHVLGVAAMTAGRIDRAVDHFRAAVDGNLALRHWPALVLSRSRYAQTLVRRGREDDLRLARAVLVTARDEADSLGLPLPDHAREQPGRRPPATCHRSGREWCLRYGSHGVRVRDSVGMAYLAVLLADPGRSVSAVDLAAGLRALRGAEPPEPAGARSTVDERARLAVSRAVRRAIGAVSRLDPEIGAHLDECVRTGARCSYLPD
jgi:hypothetical protein